MPRGRPRRDKHQREMEWIAAYLTDEDVKENDAPSSRAWNRLLAARDDGAKFWAAFDKYKEKALQAAKALEVKQLELSGKGEVDDIMGIAEAEKILKNLKQTQKKTFDFLKPPSDPIENMEWRVALRKICQKNANARNAVIAKCADDVVYFFQGFCYLFEPRPKPKKIPFILWEHQVPVVRAMDENLGECDMGLEKSRAEGASWMFLMMFFHRWLFAPYSTFGLVSRTEDAVDLKDDPDSLMWKYDFQLEHLPPWMTPKVWNRSYGNHTLINKDNNSSITGYSAVGDVASGGRKVAFAMDELAKFPKGSDYDAMNSTQHVTDCRILVSTPKGSTGAYYDAMHEEGNMIKLILDWKDNSSKNQGLYRVDKNGISHDMNASRPLTAEQRSGLSDLHEKLRRRGYKLEGSVRSPWYDTQCLRAGATPVGVAQELDRDYGGSEAQLFGPDAQAMVKATCKPPNITGMLGYDNETYKPLWENRPLGDFHLWHQLHHGKPAESNYVIGCDVASGLGGTMTSNSVLQVIDLVGSEQVAEYATNVVKPSDFAEFAYAVCKWYHNAFLIWEDNGPSGQAFHNRFMEFSYSNIYFRKSGHKGLGKAFTNKPGFHTDDKNKPVVIQDLDYAIRADQLRIRSSNLQKELGDYVYKDGKIIQAKATRTQDESSKGAAHGDRVIALALAWHVAREKERGEKFKVSQGPPQGSPAWRREKWQKKQKEEALW